jgi:hypothetical protein
MKVITPLAPVEFRSRAAQCRAMADRSPAIGDDLLIVAGHWDVLADHAEALLRFQQQLEAGKS